MEMMTKEAAKVERLSVCIDGLRNGPHATNWRRKHQGEIDALPEAERGVVVARFDAKVAALDAAWREAHPKQDAPTAA